MYLTVRIANEGYRGSRCRNRTRLGRCSQLCAYMLYVARHRRIIYASIVESRNRNRIEVATFFMVKVRLYLFAYLAKV